MQQYTGISVGGLLTLIVCILIVRWYWNNSRPK